METPDEEDDLMLVKASACLLSDLERALPKVLWKHSSAGEFSHRKVHQRFRRQDLDSVITLIEPFQSEPQLLDGRLKIVLPPIVEAYVASLDLKAKSVLNDALDTPSALCAILYTLCKVRGHKVVAGFLNNEPRYLEPILTQLETIVDIESGGETKWQASYVLLLWLSHLLLTPFDLTSISNRPLPQDTPSDVPLPLGLPPVVLRILRIGFRYLPSSTKAQGTAVMLLVRLAARPDMLKLGLANELVSHALDSIQDTSPKASPSMYERLGSLRLLSGISSLAEVAHLIPRIYRACTDLFGDETSSFSGNAVAKKIIIKIFRNATILSLHSAAAEGPLLSFLQTTSVLEDVINSLLHALGDRDTPVRYASAKALSLIVLELEPEMAHEVIQAVLDTFKEDLPRRGQSLDFRTANVLKWHGLTLTLAHTLFKRSASPDQLPEIVDALVSALQFEQRTATGGSVGTNVRDAVNFGIWSLSRRYTTEELLSTKATPINPQGHPKGHDSVLHGLSIELILSACLDPAGNVRRGSSAALQEVVGRHPNQIHEGITLVQVVDYQAVGLRRRAMVDVAGRAAELHPSYWDAILRGSFGWRGLRSPDVPSRQAAAALIANLTTNFESHGLVIARSIEQLRQSRPSEVEALHGLTLALAFLLENLVKPEPQDDTSDDDLKHFVIAHFCDILRILQTATKDFSSRLVRSDLPASVARLLAAACRLQCKSAARGLSLSLPFEIVNTLMERILSCHEHNIQQATPSMVRSLLTAKQRAGIPLGCVGARTLCEKVAVDGSKSTLHGACRAIALGSLAPLYEDRTTGDKALAAIRTLAGLTEATTVDWRVIGLKAMQLSVEATQKDFDVGSELIEVVVQAVHRGFNDYTIDERGDVGSLVRLQAVSCAFHIFANESFIVHKEAIQVLRADMIRLSLEKLDRVRLAAAQCLRRYGDYETATLSVAYVSSYGYFHEALQSLMDGELKWKHKSLLEGCISCAGISAEPLLQVSRAAVATVLSTASNETLLDLLSLFADILKSCLLDPNKLHAALEILAFLLDMQIPQRLAQSAFKWRTLLSTVQKAHHKSNDIPRILAAVHVYGGLVEIPAVRDDVTKKLINMLKTNPYPRIRASVGETMYMVTKDPVLKEKDWMLPASRHDETSGQLMQRYGTQ